MNKNLATRRFLNRYSAGDALTIREPTDIPIKTNNLQLYIKPTFLGRNFAYSHTDLVNNNCETKNPTAGIGIKTQSLDVRDHYCIHC